MKKYISLLLTLALLFSLGTAVLADGPVFDRVGLILDTRVDYGAPKFQRLVFDLRDGDTEELLDSCTYEVADTGVIRLEFAVPEYEIGKRFILHMSQGEAELEYNGQTGAYFVLETYAYPDANGVWQLYNTEFYMTLTAASERFVNLRLDGKERPDVPLYAFPQGILIPAAALKSLGIESAPAEDGGLLLSVGERRMAVYADQPVAYTDPEAVSLALPPLYIDNMMYVPVADTAAVFGCAVDYSDDGRTLDLSLGWSPYAWTAEEKLINSRQVASDTNYLVWVSKSEYKVHVFTGSSGNWRLVRSMDCAIGAPSTPTIEGTFKYYQRQDRWNYDNYYCGPIMRFYRGYALHSTLLRYNGTDYDGRTGMRISHGCVRLRPENINWMVETIPLQTTIYVTA